MAGTFFPKTALRGPQRLEWEALQGESDPQLYASGLLGFAQRQGQMGQLELAAEVLRHLEATGPEPLRGRVRRELEAMLGQGTFGPRAEFLLRNLAQQASEPSSLLAMGAAGTVFRMTRLLTLSRLCQADSLGWMTCLLGAGRLATLAGFAAEAPAFVLAGRLGGEVLGRRQDWSFRALAGEFASSYLLLGALKLGTGFGAGVARALPDGPWRGLLRQGGTLAGIALGRRLEASWGPHPQPGGATELTDSLALLLQFQVAAGLGRGLFGNKLHAWERAFDLQAAALNPAGGWSAGPQAIPAGAGGEGQGLPGRRVEPRFLGHFMQMSGEGGSGGAGKKAGAVDSPGWSGRLGSVLAKLPEWFRGNRSPPVPADEPAETAPYRRQPYHFATPAAARAHGEGLWQLVLDPNQAPELRLTGLAEVEAYYEGLRRAAWDYQGNLRQGLQRLQGLIRDPGVRYLEPEGWPEILLQREIPLPKSVADFYRSDLLIRGRAAELFADLHRRPPVSTPLLKNGVVFLESAVRQPGLSTKFRTYWRPDVWSRAYFAAEAQARQALFRAYARLLPQLPVGSVEAVQGFRLLTEEPLLAMARGEGPLPDYLSDPAWVVELLSAQAELLRLLPLRHPEVQRADRILSPLLQSLGERAQEGDPAAIEALGRFAVSDGSAVALLQDLAERGNPIARNLLAKGRP